MNHSHHPGVPTPEHVSNTTTLARVWLNRQEAADYLGVHLNTLDRHVKAGRLPAHRLGTTVRLHRAELDSAMFGDAA